MAVYALGPPVFLPLCVSVLTSSAEASTAQRGWGPPSWPYGILTKIVSKCSPILRSWAFSIST